MTRRQNPGIGGIRDPNHEVAAGMHRAERHEIGSEHHSRGEDSRRIPVWGIVAAVVVIALLVFWAVEVTGTTAVVENLG